MQRNYTFLACVYGLFVVTMRCITYVAVYNCLYAISRRLYESKELVEKVLLEIVDLIPSGWQYPEFACARIIYEEQEYKCQDFKETPWKQSCDLLLKGEKVGLLEVYYLEEKPAGDEGPFLKEEIILLQAIADQLTAGGVVTGHGGRWHPSTVQRLIQRRQ